MFRATRVVPQQRPNPAHKRLARPLPLQDGVAGSGEESRSLPGREYEYQGLEIEFGTGCVRASE